MYQNDKVNVPILGLIENMAYFTPAEVAEEEDEADELLETKNQELLETKNQELLEAKESRARIQEAGVDHTKNSC